MSDKIKTLSAAIRLGSTFRPQCRNAFFQHGASCALGAAWEALGNEPKDNIQIGHELWLRFEIPINIFEQIPKRNDAGDTREEIADWLSAQGL